MSRGGQLRVSRTRSIPKPNEYVAALYGELAAYCVDEENAPPHRGRWRTNVFGGADEAQPLDLEIGTGNGFHFAHHAHGHPGRLVLGIELKYKPLIQSIRRARRELCENARMIRYNAVLLNELFFAEEINNVFIHFPDPWAKIRQHKHRLLQVEFLARLHTVQRPGSLVEIKTDNQEYFSWAMERVQTSSYRVLHQSTDLHHSPWAANNFVTQFESIFHRAGQPICWAQLQK